MYHLLFLLSLFLTSINCDLLSDRIYAVSNIWLLRATNATDMTLAYSDQYSNSATYHTVRNVGDFGPHDIAESYDDLTILLVSFIGYQPFVLKPVFDPSTTQWLDNNTF